MRAALLASILLAASASAQPDWRPRPSGPSVSLDGLWSTPRSYGTAVDVNGNAFGEVRAGPLHSVLILSADVPVGERVRALARVPVVVFDVGMSGQSLGSEVYDETTVRLGNPYLGASATIGGGASAEGGLWLPLATRSEGDGDLYIVYGGPTSWVGGEVDYEHIEAYKEATLSARVRLGVERDVAPGLRLRLQAAPVYSYVVGEGPPVRPEFEELYGDFRIPRGNAAVTGGALADARLGPVMVTGGFVGRYDGAGGSDTFIDGAGHWASGLLGVAAEGLPVRPGLLLRIPVAGHTSTDAAVGLSLDVPLR